MHKMTCGGSKGGGIILYYGKGSARIRLQWAYLLMAQVSFLLFGALLLGVRATPTRCIMVSACGQNSACVRKLEGYMMALFQLRSDALDKQCVRV